MGSMLHFELVVQINQDAWRASCLVLVVDNFVEPTQIRLDFLAFVLGIGRHWTFFFAPSGRD